MLRWKKRETGVGEAVDAGFAARSMASEFITAADG
jgi:hypothetical protein